MPKIVRLHRFGGPENLRIDELPTQPPGPDEVRLRIQAASITRDQFTFMAGEQFRGHGFVQPQLPSRFGYECAGVVEAVGEGVDASWLGKRVAPMPGYDESRYGTLGAEGIIPATFLTEYPANLSSEQAAACWVPYLTSYGAFVLVAPVQPGDFVAIPAGASAVGMAAMQYVHDAGGQAILLTRSRAKKDELLTLGANHVIVTQEEDYEERIREITGGKGVRITFDPVAGPFLAQLANAASPGGILIVYGRQSGQPTPFPLMPVVGKGLTVRGLTMSEVARNPQRAEAAKRYILDRLSDGRFVPTVAQTFSIENIQDAYQLLQDNQQIGRVVITMP